MSFYGLKTVKSVYVAVINPKKRSNKLPITNPVKSLVDCSEVNKENVDLKKGINTNSKKNEEQTPNPVKKELAKPLLVSKKKISDMSDIALQFYGVDENDLATDCDIDLETVNTEDVNLDEVAD